MEGGAGTALLGFVYLLIGYGVFLWVAYKYYIYLAIRWGVEWRDDLIPIAKRSVLLAGMPMAGVGILICVGAIGSEGGVAQAALFFSLLALCGLTAYQAWALAQQYKAEEAEVAARNQPNGPSVGSDDDIG